MVLAFTGHAFGGVHAAACVLTARHVRDRCLPRPEEAKRRRTVETIRDARRVAWRRVDVNERADAALLKLLEHCQQRVEAAADEALGREAIIERRAATDRRVHDPVAYRDPHCVNAERDSVVEHLVGDVAFPVVAHGLDGKGVALLLAERDYEVKL